MALFTNQMRMTGMSGMDVNDIVTQLMRGHSMRLDRMRQNRDIMRWQQDMLRGVARDMRTFRSEFTISGAPSDIRSAANFTGFRSTVTDAVTGNAVSGVRITASGANARAGTQKIYIHQVARNDVFRSANTIHAGAVTGNFVRTGDFPGGGVASLDAFRPRLADPSTAPPTTAHPGGVNFRINVNGRNETFNLGADRLFFTRQQETMAHDDWAAWAATAGNVANVNSPTTDELNDFLRYLDSAHVDFTTAEFNETVARFSDDEFQTFLQNELNTWLGTQFGSDSLGDPNQGTTSRQRVWASINNDGQLTFNSREGHSVSILNGVGQHESSLGLLGFDPNRNHTTGFVPANQSMSDFLGLASLADADSFTINGFTFEFRPVDVMNDATPPVAIGQRYAIYRNGVRIPTSNTAVDSEPTVQDLMNAVNNTSGIGVRMNFGANTGRFTLESTGIGARNAIRFGDPSNPNQANDTAGLGNLLFERMRFVNDNGAILTNVHTSAQDTVIEIDGRRFERDVNNFTLAEFGLTFNLDHNAIGEIPSGVPLEVNVTNERDTSGTMQLIRDFVDSYNQLIRSMRDLTSTRRPRQSDRRSFYMPLTDDQRRAMSDREIDMWEAQARTGLLNRDDTLRRMMDDLHRSIFMDVQLSGGGTINLLHLGIRTSSNLGEFGELQIDETRAANLDWWLENRLEDVTELFTRFSNMPAGGQSGPERADRRRDRLADAGIGQRIDDLIFWATTTDGIFTERAGMPGDPSAEMNRMSRRIENENRRIEDMITNLQRREARYFQVFGRLEASMMQANSQMMFLEQMFWMG